MTAWTSLVQVDFLGPLFIFKSIHTYIGKIFSNSVSPLSSEPWSALHLDQETGASHEASQASLAAWLHVVCPMYVCIQINVCISNVCVYSFRSSKWVFWIFLSIIGTIIYWFSEPSYFQPKKPFNYMYKRKNLKYETETGMYAFAGWMLGS